MRSTDYWLQLTRSATWGEVEDYWRLDPVALEKALRRHAEDFWTRHGARRALRLFHAVAQRVPAYKAFLRAHRINPKTIRSVSDLEQVPFTDKSNYITTYPLADRCWDGKLEDASLVAVSSGISGKPTFWPRHGRHEMEAAVIHEMAYRSLFAIQNKRTLAVIGFPMGIYVSGVATLLPTWLSSQRGYPLTSVSVGNHKDQALRVIEELGGTFDQVLVIGHPFFVKDLIETGKRQGISWKKLNLRMLFCSEGFSEQWRAYVHRQAGLPGNAVASFNTYGSSETLLIGHETPLSITLRRTMKEKPLPNVFQYNPLLRFIHEHEGELLFTSDSGIPLVRFNLHDAGMVMTYSKGIQMLRAAGSTPPKGSWRLPFVTLKGRADHTLVFYAANIYPEHVHAALNAPLFLKDITGKFTMRKDYDRKQEAFLELNIELQEGVQPSKKMTAALAAHVTRELRRINMEYDFLWNHLGKDLTPRVILRPYQDPSHFRPGLKPKYLIED